MEVIKVPHLEINEFKTFEFTEKLPESKDLENVTVNKLIDISEKKSFRDNTYEEVGLILHGMGMEKYIKLFLDEKIDLDTFLHLKENDLKELGITDPQDKEIILKNLKFHHTNKDFRIYENHYEDLKIAKNIYSLLILQQNYCTYLDLQMKKHDLKDYKINVNQSAVTYLKTFTESALVQAQLMSQELFNDTDSGHLIEKALKVNNFELPNHLKEKLIIRKRNKKLIARLIVATGIIGISVLIGRQIINKSLVKS